VFDGASTMGDRIVSDQLTSNSLIEQGLIRRFFASFNIILPPSPISPPTHQPLTSTLLQLAALIGLAIGFHFTIADITIATYALLVYLFKLTLIVGKSKSAAPPQTVIMLLTIICIGLIVWLYGGWNGQRAGISFLVLLVSLKFLESRTLRDYFVVCLILFFLAASSFLFNSSIVNIGIIMIYTLAITAIMFKLSNPNSIDWKSSMRAASGVVTKALPIALLLFLFFPRISGNFGFFPGQDGRQFDNELNNTLVAGDIATSAFNNALAFRVEFDGPIPANQDLYWRSKVMPFEENFTWSVRAPNPGDIRNAQVKLTHLAKLQDQANVSRYSILHEPSTDLFIPYLDYPISFSRGRFLNDYSIWQRRSQGGTFSYQGESIATSSFAETTQVNTDRLLQSTSQPSARTQALLTRWRQQSNDPIELAQIVLRHFNQEGFAYSLIPPGLNEFTPLDDFLFNTKTGYCEHYAAVFTTIMRWLEVPARVVAGYQGGSANQTGEYLEVRYSDAHAWSEIYVNQRWQRVDPTAAINPDRIEFGMDALISAWESGEYDGFAGSSLANFLNPTGADRYLRLMRDHWSNLGYQWNKWVVNYNSDTQKELLSKLGLQTRHTYRYLLMIMCLSVGGIMAFYFWRLLPKRVKRDEVQELYLQFIGRFRQLELVKNPADTPNDFAQKAIQICPKQQDQIKAITNAYIQLRYTKTGFEANKFKQMVKQFKLLNNRLSNYKP